MTKTAKKRLERELALWILERRGPGVASGGTRDFPVSISQELDGSVGENLRLESGRMPDEIYFPKPERNQVTVVENDDLLEV